MNTAKQNKNIYVTVIILVAIISLILGLYFSQVMHSNGSTHQIDPNKFSGTLLNTPRQLDDFNLTSTEIPHYTKANLKGHWTLMFFGYTNCPELCPTTLAKLDKLYKTLQADKVKNLPEVMLVSLDPQHDSPQKMKQYVTAFNPNFKGLTGEPHQINHMTQQMGIVYMTVKGGTNPDDYKIEHSGTLVLMNPEGDIAAYFSLPHNPKKIAADYEMLVV